MKLFDTDHPYYMAEGCFFSNECHREFENWEDFLYEFGDADIDMNLIFRWDWEDQTKESPEELDGEEPKQILKIYFIMQRKAYPVSCFIEVTKEQEPEIREFLSHRWENLKEMWEPFS